MRLKDCYQLALQLLSSRGFLRIVHTREQDGLTCRTYARDFPLTIWAELPDINQTYLSGRHSIGLLHFLEASLPTQRTINCAHSHESLLVHSLRRRVET